MSTQNSMGVLQLWKCKGHMMNTWMHIICTVFIPCIPDTDTSFPMWDSLIVQWPVQQAECVRARLQKIAGWAACNLTSVTVNSVAPLLPEHSIVQALLADMSAGKEPQKAAAAGEEDDDDDASDLSDDLEVCLSSGAALTVQLPTVPVYQQLPTF
jgi:hypothetical protein